MSYRILVKQSACEISPEHIEDVSVSHLQYRQAASGTFEIEIVTKNKIHQLNKIYRNIDAPTDVLSFPAAEFPIPAGEQGRREKLYGTIFLCCDIIKLNAKESGKSFLEEFDFIVKHGLDHLIGIHHDD